MDESWGQTDVELTRRHELIPNLVSTVSACAAHEATVLEALSRAREEAAAHQGEAPHSRQRLLRTGCSAVHDVLVRAEAYPGLKASAKLPPAPRRAHQHRGPHRRGAPLLQRQCARLQHEGRDVSPPT
ncbi:MAG: LemA family protein [Nocardioides sp.]